MSSVSDGGPVKFLPLGIILVARAKVIKMDGTDLHDPDQDEKVDIVSNFLHSLFN